MRPPLQLPGWENPTGEGIGYPLQYFWVSLMAQLVKNLPAMRKTWVGKIPWKRAWQPTPVFWPGAFHGLLQSMGWQKVDHDRTTFTSMHFYPKAMPRLKAVWGMSFFFYVFAYLIWFLPQHLTSAVLACGCILSAGLHD